MSDPISGQIAQQAANQAAGQNAQQMPQPEVNAQDQARFEDAMGQTGQTNSTEHVDPTQNDPSMVNNPNGDTFVNNPDAASVPPSLGEAILDSVQRMRANHDAKADSIEQKLINSEGKEMSMKDCIELQFEVMQMSIEQDLTGKIADKTSNGVQTLFRNQ